MLIYLIVGTLGTGTVIMSVFYWKLYALERKCDSIWEFLYQRAEIVALKEGWVVDPKVITTKAPPEPGIGFASPSAATIMPEKKEG